MVQEVCLNPVRSAFARNAPAYDIFEKGCANRRGRQYLGIVRRDAIRVDEAGALGFGEFGKRPADFIAPGATDMDGKKVGLGKIAVVVSLFFRTHGDSVAFGLIPEACLLGDAAAGFEDADVALDFVFESFLEVAEGVEIFYFDLGAELFRTAGADAYVGVAAERAFFHVAIADAGIEHDLAERGEIGVGLFGG